MHPHKVSVVVPSRLQANPLSDKGRLYLDRALMSAKRQTADCAMEIIVGLDHDAPQPPDRFLEPSASVPLTFVRSVGAGQALALNAALRACSGDVVAILEDDDKWDPYKLAVQLPLLDRYDLVTCNQREEDEYANFVRYNDFATPSGWVMHRKTMEAIGTFDPAYQYHLDTEWLGRFNEAISRTMTRVHVVPEAYAGGDWLENVRRRSDVVESKDITEPLVFRMVNSEGGMAQIARGGIPKSKSQEEHRAMMARFSEVPW